jgi:threonine dehydrogenase-like Zn-dependent dehydrogenase
MKTRLLVTDGDDKFREMFWDKPEPDSNQIEVKSIMTGICRSDIAMMQGKFTLPYTMSGHEGLGQVTKVGKDIKDISVGDYVATRGEPAYSDFYNVRANEYVFVPEAAPKYILEPVACGINLILFPCTLMPDKIYYSKNILILGTGFLAYVAYQTLKLYNNIGVIDIDGHSNLDIWLSEGITLNERHSDSYDIIIDIRAGNETSSENILNNEALIINAVGKKMDTSQMDWASAVVVHPSPRASCFLDAMHKARLYIESNYLDIDKFWTTCYDRNSEWQKAFSDALNRPKNYGRGYIKW